MNYAITEDEYNAIDAARSQLIFVAGLVANGPATAKVYETDGLYEFLSAQSQALKGVITSATDRYDASLDKSNVMSSFDWTDIIQAVSGRVNLTGKRLKKISLKLQNCVAIDPDMALVLRAWMAVMTDDGAVQFNLEPGALDAFPTRFEAREPVVATKKSRKKLAAKTAQIDGLIARAKAAGKCTPVVEDIWRDIGEKDTTKLEFLIAHAPANPALSGVAQALPGAGAAAVASTLPTSSPVGSKQAKPRKRNKLAAKSLEVV